MDTGYALPDKLYFRIGEVSDILDVKPYVLRYWETEFSDIKPTKSKSGQRLYRKKDVEMLLKIKELLYDERFTITGAKQQLKESGRAPATAAAATPRDEAVSANVVSEAAAKQQRKEASEQAERAAEKKFLEKIKSDLKWCLAELKMG